MNIGRVARVLVDELGHLKVALGHVVRDVDGFSR
jgi:hypothetical protein